MFVVFGVVFVWLFAGVHLKHKVKPKRAPPSFSIPKTVSPDQMKPICIVMT